MGITPNGFIARPDGDSEWTSEEDLNGFFETSKRVGNIIMGKNTFKEASSQGYFPFPEALNVVVSHEEIENKWGEKVLITDEGPAQILKLLESKGFDTAFLAGGGTLNASFLEAKLVNEIYLDVEPLLFGKGIPVVAPANFECDLKLLDTKKLNDDTVQLHYEVIS
jgi:dihydrofolate reductase